MSEIDTVRAMAVRLNEIEGMQDELRVLHYQVRQELEDYRRSIITEQHLLEGCWELRAWDSAPVLIYLYGQAYPRLLEVMPPFLPWGAQSVKFENDGTEIILEINEKGHRLIFPWKCTPQQVREFCLEHHISVVVTDECRGELEKDMGNFQCRVDDTAFVLNEL